jgi:hypothetical protein
LNCSIVNEDILKNRVAIITETLDKVLYNNAARIDIPPIISQPNRGRLIFAASRIPMTKANENQRRGMMIRPLGKIRFPVPI